MFVVPQDNNETEGNADTVARYQAITHFIPALAGWQIGIIRANDAPLPLIPATLDHAALRSALAVIATMPSTTSRTSISPTKNLLATLATAQTTIVWITDSRHQHYTDQLTTELASLADQYPHFTLIDLNPSSPLMTAMTVQHELSPTLLHRISGNTPATPRDRKRLLLIMAGL